MGKSGLQDNSALSKAWLDPATGGHLNWSQQQTQKRTKKLNVADGKVKSKMCFLHCLLSSGCLGLLVSPWFYLFIGYSCGGNGLCGLGDSPGVQYWMRLAHKCTVLHIFLVRL